MRTVFGIDVSKASSEVAILVNSEKVHSYSFPNDAIGFSRLFHDLEQAYHPEIVFEARGVYSRRLEAFLSKPSGEQYWNLIIAFPISTLILKQSREELEHALRNSTSKRISDKRVAILTDKLLALAHQSYPAVSPSSPMLDEVRYYAQELLRLKTQRQDVLDNMIQLARTLPEYEILLSIPGIAETTAASLIGELGDVRRFKSSNQINAFIGIDLRHYQSGDYLAQEHITKRGNPYARKILFKAVHNVVSASRFHPCHIADFYGKRKRQSPNTSTKPYTIASMHRLIRCLYYLITHNKNYDYTLAKSQ
ncbi:transposase [Lactococcus ileimucosae]|uniref:Transposase n=1 Tax=Lactococcus ileimucosae TaxID=2941329 RepID=A0ABV4D104_9LACT